MKPVKVLVLGCGNMGSSHAMAYHTMKDEFEICGLVSRGKSKEVLNAQLGNAYPLFDDFETALNETQPDAVSIATYPDTHEKYALMAFEKGCHVFVEKPIADTLEGARRMVQAAIKHNRKLVVGYILRHHPSWKKFIELSHGLGKPLVMRMNLNQQADGKMWTLHRNLMNCLSPIVDCGVHYIDVMCQMAGAKPVQVYAIGAKLTDEVPADSYNYGQMQLRFDDGSVGWYEAGWGPMMSETAFFVKDVVGPKGSVSIVAKDAGGKGKSGSIDSHTKTESLLVHHADLDASERFSKEDITIDLTDEPDHQGLCDREQQFFYDAIANDVDLTRHMQDALNSLEIVMGADASVKTGQVVKLQLTEL